VHSTQSSAVNPSAAAQARALSRGHDAGTARMLLFSRSGFGSELVTAARDRCDVELVDLSRLYHGD